MTLDELFLAYTTTANEETLTALYSGVRSYAEQLARQWRHPDPADAAASVVASAWQHLGEFSGDSYSFQAWVKKIALNKLRDDYSKQPKDVDEFDPDTDYYPDTGRTVTLTGLTPAEVQALQALIDTRDFDATAENLGISKATLLRRLNRLKNKVVPAV